MLVENVFNGKIIKNMDYDGTDHIRIEFKDGSEFLISSMNEDKLRIFRIA